MLQQQNPKSKMISFLPVLIAVLPVCRSACNYVISEVYGISWDDGLVSVLDGAVIPTGLCMTNDTVGFNKAPMFTTTGIYNLHFLFKMS